MTSPDARDDSRQDELPIFLEGGDELTKELRDVAFGLLLATKQPVEATKLAALTGSDEPTVEARLDGLARSGRIDRDDRGRVLGSAGLTIADGPHGLQLDGHAFRTWCAFDALGIPAALAVDGRVETECGVCGGTILVDVHRGRPSSDPAPRLWFAAGGADMRADFCTPTVLLCSEAHAAEWARRQPQGGRALTLAEAADLGARNWASAAAAANRIAGT